MTAPASRLVTDGLDGARIAFGTDDGTATSATELAERGSSCFSGGGTPTVGMLMTNDRPTVEVFLGAIVTGASIVSLPPPSRGADLATYAGFLAEACHAHGVDEIVADDSVVSLMADSGLSFRGHSDLWSRPLAVPASDGFRLVQFSSGSTARPKPIVLDDAALGANITAILAAVQPRPGDAAVSWLPLSHDMGLIGMLLVSVAAMSPRWAKAGTVVLLDPAAFLRRPALWLEAIDHWQGTFTAAPDFGYQMVTRRPVSGSVDLSRLRCSIVGGEITRAETLTSFSTSYRECGLDSLAICPAYGMAELGLAATMTPPDEHWRGRTLSTAALADGMVAAARESEPATTLVASGRPLPGYEVRCDSGNGSTGQIAVRGPSIGIDGRTNQSLANPDGWYLAGDAGFIDDEWLYVCGRTDDYVVAHGRNIYAPAIEAAVGDIEGVRVGRVTAIGLPNGDWAIVAEASDPTAITTSRDTLRREVGRAAVRLTTAQPDDVILVAPGTLPLTASGKLQRNEVRRRFLKDNLTRLGED